jgi:hypothetical protein
VVQIFRLNFPSSQIPLYRARLELRGGSLAGHSNAEVTVSIVNPLNGVVVRSSGERCPFPYGLTNTVFEHRKVLALEAVVTLEDFLLNKPDNLRLVEATIIDSHFASREFAFRVRDREFRIELRGTATASPALPEVARRLERSDSITQLTVGRKVLTGECHLPEERID